MDDLDELQQEAEAIIAMADGRDRRDEEVFLRTHALIKRSPEGAHRIGAALCGDPDPGRREFGLDLVRGAGEYHRDHLRDMAIPILRHALEVESDVGPLSAAIVGLGSFDDTASHDAVLAKATHPDPIVRHAVAATAPGLGDDGAVVRALIELSADVDEEVRDWATFGLGSMTTADSPAIRDALLARVEDPHYDTRVEGIVGLVHRRDERARPFLLRELAAPDHAVILDEALLYLNGGAGVRFFTEDD